MNQIAINGKKIESNYCQNWQYLNIFKLLPKLAIFGQAVSYTGSESNYYQKWKKIESNYCQNWQYLDKISSNMDAKGCQKWQKTLNKSCQFWQLNIPGSNVPTLVLLFRGSGYPLHLFDLSFPCLPISLNALPSFCNW